MSKVKEKGRFRKSRQWTGRIDSEDSVARVLETARMETVRIIKGPANRKAVIKVKIFDHGRAIIEEKVEFIIDSEVKKSLLRKKE